MRVHYAERRRWLEEALQTHGFDVVAQQGGIQLVVNISGDDRLQARRARDAGLAVQAVNDWRTNGDGTPGLIMSFTNITSQAMANEQVSALKLALN